MADGARRRPQGRRQCDVVAEIQHAQALGTPDAGRGLPGDRADAADRRDGRHPPPDVERRRRSRRGEATTIELAGVYRRYHAPLARTVVSAAPRRGCVGCADGRRRGHGGGAGGSCGPGAPATTCTAAFTEVISRHGLTKESRIGYSIGIGYPPDWGERTVSLRARKPTTVLAAGMAFHVILGMWMDGWGYETSEPVVVTERRRRAADPRPARADRQGVTRPP